MNFLNVKLFRWMARCSPRSMTRRNQRVKGDCLYSSLFYFLIDDFRFTFFLFILSYAIDQYWSMVMLLT